MEILSALGPFVPLVQTLLWIILIAILLIAFRHQAKGIVSAVQKRIEGGSQVKAGPFELGEDLKELKYIDTGTAAKPSEEKREPIAPGRPQSWEAARVGIYEKNRGIFLAHVIEPSKHPNQVYDIFIYLVRHNQNGFGDVDKAEFFFGHMWGNEIFEADLARDLIGISTSAYGPFLCLCKVTFKDGSTIDLSRYIDFEMGRVFDKSLG